MLVFGRPPSADGSQTLSVTVARPRHLSLSLSPQFRRGPLGNGGPRAGPWNRLDTAVLHPPPRLQTPRPRGFRAACEEPALTSARFLRLVVAGNWSARPPAPSGAGLPPGAGPAAGSRGGGLHGEPGPRAGWTEGGGRRSGLVPWPLPHACPPLSPCPSLCLCRQAQAHRLTLRGPGVTEAVLQTTGPCPAPGHARRFWAAR